MSGTVPTVERLVMPGMRWVFEWRSDGWWRERDADFGLDAGDEQWTRWSGGTTALGGRGGRWDGEPTHMMVWGEISPGGEVHVQLADRSTPAIRQLGGLWACEWFSTAQAATIRVGGTETVLAWRRPHYLE